MKLDVIQIVQTPEQVVHKKYTTIIRKFHTDSMLKNGNFILYRRKTEIKYMYMIYKFLRRNKK